ncbi:MAG: SUMF1/EgtB/PvdO family nonheme iron enzyme [Chloroflexi bacterium]|nr:SUMF1/EgtB/PvdO family nonheme iron enzyme [Chloroflexota bacterium]
MAETKPPKVFISYAWEDELKTWVLDFATRLRSDGINAILDRWETVPGDQLTQFMEKSVRESDFVVFICTPTYKRKSDRRRGGVGYEGSIITGEVFAKNNHRKFIPALRKGKWAVAAPSWATSKLFIDFRGDPYSEVSYQQLLNTLFGKSPTAPPIRDDSLREKEERETAEKAAREKVELEASNKIVREKAEYEAAEKAKREVVEKEERERMERETTERLDREASEKATREKEEQEAAEKVEEEKKQRELKRALKKVDQEYKRQIRKIEWQHRWESFVSAIRYRLKLLYIYRASILILLVTFGLIVPLLIRLSNLIPKITSEFNNAPTAIIGLSPLPQPNLTSTNVFISTEILTPSKTPTKNFTLTSLPTEITDAKGVIMELVSNNGVDSFYMDKYEVTNLLYKTCVDSGVCTTPFNFNYYDQEPYLNYPVVYVSRDNAKTYCEWRGSRLPTSDEWEQASETAQSIFWIGKQDCKYANFAYGFETYYDKSGYYRQRYSYCVGHIVPVGSYEEGRSIYNIYDLIGNVAEWTDYSKTNGGSWSTFISGQNMWWRFDNILNPDHTSNHIGFRCAKDTSP